MNLKIQRKSAGWLLLAVLAGLLITVPVHAGPGYYVTTGQNDQNVYATAVIYGADPGMGLKVTVDLRNPLNTASDFDDSGENFYSYSVSANAQVAKGVVDGNYTATSQNYSIAWPGATPFWLGQAQQQQNVSPWVQLVRTSLASPNMATTSGTDTFYAYILTSLNCAGGVTVSSGMTYPTGMLVEIQSAGGTWNTVTAAYSVTMSGGSNATLPYPVRTTVSNTVTGSVTVSASFSSWPGSCTTKGPDAGSSHTVTQTIRVPM